MALRHVKQNNFSDTGRDPEYYYASGINFENGFLDLDPGDCGGKGANL